MGINKILSIFVFFALSAAMLESLESNVESMVNVTPAYYKFGVISDSKTVHYTLSIHNNSDKVLKIVNIKTPCSCTVATPHSQKFKPGETGNLRIVFNPKNRQGYLRWEISIITNLQKLPIRVAFDATVLKDDFISHRMMYFEEFERGSRPEKKLWFSPRRRHESDSLGLFGYPAYPIYKCYVKIEGQRDCFDVSWNPCTYRGFYPGARPAYCIRVVPKKDIPFGRIQGELHIISGMPGKKEIKIPLIAKVVGEIGISRDYLTMGIVTKKRPVMKRMMLYHRKGGTFKISRVQSSLPFLTATIENVIPDQYYELRVTSKLEDNFSKGEFRGKLIITTSSEQQPEIIVMVQGFIR